MNYLSAGLFLFILIPAQCLPAQNVSTQNVPDQSVPAQSEPALDVSAQSDPLESITPEEKMCLEDFTVWKRTQKKCRSCQPCNYGTGRNFTDYASLTREPNGDMRCPPCNDCPPGFYNNNKRSSRCSQCKTVCVTRNRHMQEECNPTSDAKCGACLPGFEDKYRNIDFPCLKKIRNSDTETPETPRTEAIAERPVKNITGIVNSKDGVISLPEPPDGKVVLINLTVASVLGVLLLLIALFLCYRKYRLSKNQSNRGYIPASSSSLLGNLTEDTDLELDRAVENQENIGRRIAGYFRQTSDDGKKGKLPQRSIRESYGNGSFVRAEDGRSMDTCGPNAMQSIQWRNYPKIGKQCPCRLIPACGCYNVLTSRKDINLDRNNRYFRTVATNVCHDPTPLFVGLGIPWADIYQINNDRDRDPEKLSESEMVVRLLKKWIEKTPHGATLMRLCTELCKAGFHTITGKVLDLPVQEASAS